MHVHKQKGRPFKTQLKRDIRLNLRLNAIESMLLATVTGLHIAHSGKDKSQADTIIFALERYKKELELLPPLPILEAIRQEQLPDLFLEANR